MKIQKRISDRGLNAFKAAYEEEFDDILTDEKAQEIAFDLLRFFDAAADRAGTNTRQPI
jgi:hypothetical protein